MRKVYARLLILLLLMAFCFSMVSGQAKTTVLRYAHMNAPNSAAGVQATFFAELVEKYTDGQVKIQVYPSSQLGNLQEVAEGVSTGTIAICHNTMAAIGSLYNEFEAFDTPYLYRDVDHLMKAADPNSTVMKRLNEALIKTRKARVLYTFFFGTRHLTANKAIYTLNDLKGVKIRSIPFPIYMTAVEGMGAIAVPLDWADVPTALATGVVHGQENPIDTIYSAKIYDIQSHLMLTGHILGAEIVIMNEKVWSQFPDSIKRAIQKAATEASQKGTELTLKNDAEQLALLKEKGMTVIGPEDGLDIEAFRKAVTEEVNRRFGDKYGKFYGEVRAMK